MSKYEMIKIIVENKTMNEKDKMFYVEMVVKGWYTQKDLEWIIGN